MIRRTIYNSSNCISRFSSQSIRCCSNNSLRKELELSLRQQHHHQNYSTSTDSINGSVSNRLWNYTKLTGLLIGVTTSIVYLTDTRSSIHSWLSLPILNLISDGDPEKAHSLAVKALKFVGQKGLIKDRVDDSDRLSFELWGKKFKNPIGLAAGFDKDGDCIDGLFDIGFGYVEIGSITPEAQPGNPRPRLFKLSSTDSIINRYGFNSEGHLPVLIKLRNRILNFVERNRYSILNNDRSSNLDRDDLDLIQKIFEPSSSPIPSTEGQSLRDQEANDLFRIDERLDGLIEKIGLQNSLRPQSVLAINLGKNLTTATTDSIKDFKLGIQRFNHLADLLVINISSPNTPGLRDLQGKEFLEELLKDLIQTRDELGSKDEGRRKTPVLIKISPDLSVEELVEISEVAKESKVDGIIVSNTTIQRPIECGTVVENELLKERGGLSGPPLKPLSLRALSIIYSNTQGTIPLIGCGGISSGRDVLDYGLAGASFVQLYSSLVFGGIGLPRRIKDELVELLDDYKDKYHEQSQKEALEQQEEIIEGERILRDGNDPGRKLRWKDIVGRGAEGRIEGLTIQQLLEREREAKRLEEMERSDQRFREATEKIREEYRKLEGLVRSFEEERRDERSREFFKKILVDEDSKMKTNSSCKSDENGNFKEDGKAESGDVDNGGVLVDGEGRGILIGWKNKRQNEIEEKNFIRSV